MCHWEFCFKGFTSKHNFADAVHGTRKVEKQWSSGWHAMSSLAVRGMNME